MPLATGAKLGPHEIVQLLGEGGMGVVYKARDSRLKRFVAVKVLRAAAMADSERRRRFIQEAQAASALNHPNIITIYDIGEQDGIDFMAMEFVAGKTLDALIPRTGMPLKEALRIALQIAAGLERAHAAGIVHRDLKPGNVIVGDDGQVKIVDFGLAKLTERTAAAGAPTETVKLEMTETAERTVVGTVAYMSPEQAEARPVDARSDIFSFGSMLYEMITGHRAFHGQSAMSAMSAILNQEPKPVSSLAPETPRDLEKVIQRCLRKDLERRFQHMGDVRIALLELKEESDSGLLAPQTNPHARRRSRLIWIATSLITVLVASVVVAWSLRRSHAPAPQPRSKLITSDQGYQSHPALSPDGKQVAYSWDGGEEGRLSIYVRLVDAGSPLRLTQESGVDDLNPTWSPDGHYIAFCRQRLGAFDILRIAALGGASRKIAAGTDCAGLSWSPDGAFLAIGQRVGNEPRSISLVSMDDGHSVRLTSPPRGSLGDFGPKFSPDGKKIVFVRAQSDANRELWVVPVGGGGTPAGEARRMGYPADGLAIGADWTADGRRIVFSSGWFFRGAVSIIPAEGGPLRAFPGADNAGYISIARSGSRMVYEHLNFDSNIWRIPGPQSTERDGPKRLIASTQLDLEPQYSPDGSKIAFTSARSGTLELWVSDRDGREAAQITSVGGAQIGSPRWSPDGRWLAFDNPQAGNYDICLVSVEGGPYRRFTSEPSNETRPSWSRDGHWIYFGSNRSGDWQIWKAPVGGGAAVQVTRGGGEEAFESIDGKYVYWAKRGKHGIWQMPVGGGEEKQITDSGPEGGFTVAQPGLWFIDTGGPVAKLMVFNQAAERITAFHDFPHGTILDFTSTIMSISPDGRWIVYTQYDQSGSNLMLVDDFR
jgi:serine/threonine protein kinase